MDTLAFGYVIPAIRAYSGLPPVRQCSCRAYNYKLVKQCLTNSNSQTNQFVKHRLTNLRYHFIMELGKGYAFVARQQHIKTDMGDFYIDLVFYNIILKSYLIIDLKTTQITHQDVGQMDMYVRMYDELKKEEGNNPTIGLVLCSDTSKDLARYSILKDSKQLFAAKYLTYLPTEEELSREIREQKEFFELQKGKEAEDED